MIPHRVVLIRRASGASAAGIPWRALGSHRDRLDNSRHTGIGAPDSAKSPSMVW